MQSFSLVMKVFWTKMAFRWSVSVVMKIIMNWTPKLTAFHNLICVNCDYTIRVVSHYMHLPNFFACAVIPSPLMNFNYCPKSKRGIERHFASDPGCFEAAFDLWKLHIWVGLHFLNNGICKGYSTLRIYAGPPGRSTFSFCTLWQKLSVL